MIKSYLKPGRYNPSPDMFVYYECGANCFFAQIDAKKNIVEVCYGPSAGGADYFDLSLSAKADLLEIIELNGADTRKLMKYVRTNDLNKEEKSTNGLSVKYNLVGKDGNAFSLLAGFKQAALRQKKDPQEIESVLKEAKSGNYSHLLCTLMANTI